MKRILALAALLGAPVVMQGQTWNWGPNGSTNITFDASWVGFVECGLSPYIYEGSCMNTRNGMRLTNGSAWVDFSVVGNSGILTVSTIPSTVALGTISVVRGGIGTYVLPPSHPEARFLKLGYRFQSADLNANAVLGRVYRPDGQGGLFPSSSVNGGGAYIDIPLGVAPTNGYRMNLLFHSVTYPEFTFDNDAEYAVSVTGQLIPEPSTYTLMAAGLVSLVLLRRRVRTQPIR